MIKIIWVGVCFSVALRSMGCDVCGIFLNVQPNDRSTQFGLLHRVRMLSREYPAPQAVAVPKHGGVDHAQIVQGPRAVSELIQAMELRADIRFRDKWALLVAVPVVNTYQSVNGYMRYDAYGLGDPFAILRYQVVNTKCTADDSTGRWVHRLQFGGGVKMPLGRSDVTYQGERLHPDAQPGTGSWDALFSLEYALRIRRSGVTFTTVGRVNSADRYDVRLGHTASSTLDLFHRFPVGKQINVLPSLGGYMEWAGYDNEKGAVQTNTGGTTWYATAGLRTYWKKWMLTVNYQRALAWNIGDDMTATDFRLITGLSYFINN